jgi:threonine synthase
LIEAVHQPAILCSSCRRPYPDEGLPYRCPTCAGIFDYAGPWSYEPEAINPDDRGIWKYAHTFGFRLETTALTLGEGDTPLVWADVLRRRVAFKLEYLNPTGSFKDRGTAPLVSFLKSRQVGRVVEDSSGNAGSSLAAYCARAGIEAHIYVPDSASGPKRAQIEAYGARLVRIMGPRSNAAEAVSRAAENGEVYASHVFLPHGLPGIATIAYELFEQLGEAPGAVIAPVGHGSLLLGVGRGFKALHKAGLITRTPRLFGVQARACAPLWALSSFGSAGLGWVAEGPTLAEGIRISHPARGDAVLDIVEQSSGEFIVVDEEEIIAGVEQLARRGMYVEPTSATVWNPLLNVLPDAPDPVVVVLTGSGFKSRYIS